MIWDLAYQPWKHSMIACDDSGTVYISVLSNMRRRWGVIKANHKERLIKIMIVLSNFIADIPRKT